MGKRIIVIGGGPAGYVAAIRGAQLGAEMHIIEMGRLGGTCLNVGCIPTKALLGISEFYQKAAASTVPGVKSSAELDWAAALAHKEAVVTRLTGGVSWLLQKNGVKVHEGRAEVLPGLRVRVGAEMLDADAVILAPGSVNVDLPFSGHETEGVIGSTEALSLREPPKALTVVGGGVIGVELATLYAGLGTRVTIVEMLPEILPTVDVEIAGLLSAKLKASGVRVCVGATLIRVAEMGSGLSAYVKLDGQIEEILTDKVLVAVGRRPNTAGLGLESLGVTMERGAVVTDSDYQTNIPGLYAVGDCNAKLMLAHAAMDQGVDAIMHIMGAKPYYKHKYIPSCVYTHPEIASVGMTEKQIVDKGISYNVGRFSLSGNGKAVIEGEDGLIKILADKEYGEVLGVHMIGSRATEMIAEAVLCMDMEGTAEDIANSVHAHPTVSEAMGEAAWAVYGKAIHGA
ncbi:MAG: dihydrolipoyl dehydrogenase [Peptococcaceae bacterium]|nr:dihydrolipoyl dehydrogenase [Peptococcaceae bacterium]